MALGAAALPSALGASAPSGQQGLYLEKFAPLVSSFHQPWDVPGFVLNLCVWHQRADKRPPRVQEFVSRCRIDKS